MKPKEYLQEQKIEFKEFVHPEVYTCEDAEKYTGDIKGMHLKNMFLKSKKGNYFIVIIPADERLDLKKVENLVGEKLSLGSPERLKLVLNLSPGSVSPFGLINDKENKVRVLIDKRVLSEDYVSFHPNTNTATLELTLVDFKKYLKSLNKELEVLE